MLRESFRTSRKAVIVVGTFIGVVAVVALGRGILGTAGSSTTAASHAPSANGGTQGAGGGGAVTVPKLAAPTPTTAPADQPTAPAVQPTTSGGSAGATGGGGVTQAGTPLPRVPAFPMTPQVVRTGTIDLRLTRNTLNAVLTDIPMLATSDGGYIESSSTSGGTANSSPSSADLVIRVADADFTDAMTRLSALGRVTNEQIAGKDVTDQVAENSATIQVLQDQVNLLQSKLSQTNDIDTFLQIQNQLFPVVQQLQQLQAQQAVLQNSVALSTVTVHVSAPGAPVAATPRPQPRSDAASVAWRYLRHNSLAVLDGLAVGGAWALPVLVVVAIVWLGGARVLRWRRRAATV